MKKFILLFCFICSMFCISYASNNTEALLQYNRGIDYYKLGQYDEAVGCFRASINADPNFIDAYYNLGSVLEYMQQYDAALVVFKQIVVRNPEDYESVYKAAWLSYKLGNTDKAKTFLTLIPSYSSVYNDAKKLAADMNFPLSPAPSKSDTQKTQQSRIPLNNQILQNITAPTGITSDSSGNLYIAQYTLNSILKVTPNNEKYLFVKNPKINGPVGLAMDSSNNMYVANYNANNILKISPYGELSVLISSIKNPYFIYIVNDILFVSCQGSNSILKYKL